MKHIEPAPPIVKEKQVAAERVFGISDLRRRFGYLYCNLIMWPMAIGLAASAYERLVNPLPAGPIDASQATNFRNVALSMLVSAGVSLVKLRNSIKPLRAAGNLIFAQDSEGCRFIQQDIDIMRQASCLAISAFGLIQPATIGLADFAEKVYAHGLNSSWVSATPIVTGVGLICLTGMFHVASTGCTVFKEFRNLPEFMAVQAGTARLEECTPAARGHFAALEYSRNHAL